MTSTNRTRRLRRPALAVAALAIAAGAFGGVSLAAPATAEAAECPFGLLVSSAPNKDLALGFDPATNTSNNAPLAMRDSSGLSRAELWREVPAGNFDLVALENQNADEALFYAGVNGQASGLPVVAKKADINDSTQLWRKKIVAGKVTYTSITSNKSITATFAAGKPFQQFFPGEGGVQTFIQKTVACS